MTTSLSRKARRAEDRTVRRRGTRAGALLGVAAAATLLAGGLTPAPANAALPFEENFTCEAGSGKATITPEKDYTIGGEVGPIDLTTGWRKGQVGSVDCADSSGSIVAQVGDQLIKLFAPDLPIGLSSFNRAIIIPNPASLVPTVLGQNLAEPTNATIKGNGYSVAIAAISANATSQADWYLSGAVSAAAAGGTANAKSSFLGLSVASAIGANLVNIPGVPGVKPTADANALPGGVAIALVTLNDDKASSTALGGISMATSNPLDGAKAVCTATYADASVKNSDGDNKDSCTGVLFIFQKYQKADGPVWYAIKNPFDVNLVSPISETATGGISTVLQTLGLPEQVSDVISGKIVPEFGSDLIRVSFDGGTPKVETDFFDWLGELVGAPKQETAAASTLAAGSVPALLKAPVTKDDADDSTAAKTPVVSAPEVTAPETSAPETSAPETSAPEASAPVTSAPEPSAPETSAPETSAPETSAPEPSAPETSAPETPAPAASTPEDSAPKDSAPESSTAPETGAAQSDSSAPASTPEVVPAA